MRKIYNVMNNKLLVLPEVVDIHLSEYLQKTYSTNDILILSLPGPDSTLQELNLFLDSPSAIDESHDFSGVFAIDITAYLNNFQHQYFLALIDYIKTHDKISYALFVTSSSDTLYTLLFKFLLQHFDIEKEIVPLPNDQQLLSYITDNLSSYGINLTKTMQNKLKTKLNTSASGYDVGDYWIRYIYLCKKNNLHIDFSEPSFQSVNSNNCFGY